MKKLEKELRNMGYQHKYTGHLTLFRKDYHYVLYSNNTGKVVMEFGYREEKK